MDDTKCLIWNEKMVRGLETRGRDKNSEHHLQQYKASCWIQENANNSSEWQTTEEDTKDRTVTYTDRDKQPSRGKAAAVLRGQDGYVGTAPSSCSGLISGPSARHGIKQTGESWVRAVHRRDWLDHREGGQGRAVQSMAKIITTVLYSVLFTLSRHVYVQETVRLLCICVMNIQTAVDVSDSFTAEFGLKMRQTLWPCPVWPVFKFNQILNLTCLKITESFLGIALKVLNKSYVTTTSSPIEDSTWYTLFPLS